MRRHAPEQVGDALLEHYVEWREECSAVRRAYDRWHQALRDDRAAAFAAYTAALDREERASNTYAALVQQLTPAGQPG